MTDEKERMNEKVIDYHEMDEEVKDYRTSLENLLDKTKEALLTMDDCDCPIEDIHDELRPAWDLLDEAEYAINEIVMGRRKAR